MSYHTPKPIKHLRVNTVGKSVAVDHHKEQASLEEIVSCWHLHTIWIVCRISLVIQRLYQLLYL